MSLQVSSWFIEQSRRQVASPGRHFLIGGSDYSESVLRWPRIQYKSETINLGTTSITLSNIERKFQFFVDSELSLTTSCELALSFTHPTSGEERISLYLGRPSNVGFTDGGTRLQLQLQGKTQRLTDVTVGSEVESGGEDFTNSSYLPADLAWILVTSFGGMSAIQSTSNPDIDYTQWEAWRDANTVRDNRVRAYLTGQKIYQVLNDLAAMHSVEISFQAAKLRFQQIFDAFDDVPPDFPMEHVTDVKLSVDPTRLMNRVEVFINYDPAAGKFQGSFTKADSQSEARFGSRSGRFGKTSVWFDTAVDGRYLSEDLIRFRSDPIPRVFLSTPLAGGVHRQIGDAVSLTDSFFAFNREPYRITQIGIDMERGTVGYQMEEARRRPWQYKSTVSSFNMLGQTVNALGNDVYIAAHEAAGGQRIHRTDSDGYFQPLDLYGTAVLALNGDEVLIGGPPSSDSTATVIQRSSDSGSSATVVFSMAAGIQRVYDFLEVKSGTYLASTTSGGILRSTDAGSSWSITWTISGNYFIGRFYAPNSGRIWGGTGKQTASAKGLYIWESVDEGVNWTLKHTVVPSGSEHYTTHGFHHITDSEHLLGSEDGTFTGILTFRSSQTSPDSIAWTVVRSQVTFTHVIETDSGELLMGYD
ncbi:MAG: hypothetical protein IIA27_15950, partial [Gemmatimonadetes bacterium]|nr:hypothetical protein [Gemmatimonadota bacterium]